LGIIKYQERVFLGRGRAFSMRILQQTPAITNKKTELKGDNHAWLSGSVRERQGASKRVHFLILANTRPISITAFLFNRCLIRPVRVE
jgi:hypothetical protein